MNGSGVAFRGQNLLPVIALLFNCGLIIVVKRICYLMMLIDGGSVAAVLQLTPSRDQVLFQGDVLSLSCRVPSSVYYISWYNRRY